MKEHPHQIRHWVRIGNCLLEETPELREMLRQERWRRRREWALGVYRKVLRWLKLTNP